MLSPNPEGDLRVAVLAAPDAGAYRALMLDAYDAEPAAFTSTAPERAAEPLSWWLRRVADPAGLSMTFGAFRDTWLVGAVALEFSARTRTRHKAHLAGLFVQPAWRGLGVGGALVRAAIVAARSRPAIRQVSLTVTEGNVAALSLYERCGFAIFGTEPRAIAVDGGFRAKCHLWLPIDGPAED